MDRLKFRVWHTYRSKTMRFFEDCHIDSEGDLMLHVESDYHGTSFNLAGDDYTVEQCTGLEDYEKNIVFDGDICQHPDGSTFVVRWRDSYAGFRAVYDTMNDSSLPMQFGEKGQAVVVGNIHENINLITP